MSKGKKVAAKPKTAKKGLTLANYKLHYEDLVQKSRKVVKPTKAKKKPVAKRSSNRFNTFMGSILQRGKDFYSYLHGVVNKVANRGKKPKKMTKKAMEEAKKRRQNVILGIGLLLVVVSIAYSTAVIIIGVDGLASRIALLPQVVFALVTLIKAFSSIYK